VGSSEKDVVLRRDRNRLPGTMTCAWKSIAPRPARGPDDLPVISFAPHIWRHFFLKIAAVTAPISTRKTTQALSQANGENASGLLRRRKVSYHEARWAEKSLPILNTVTGRARRQT